MKELFNAFNEGIMGIGSEVERYTTQKEIIYKTSLNIAYLAIQNNKNRIRFLLRTENDKMSDPNKLTKNIPKSFGYGKITREVFASPQEIKSNKYQVEDVLNLIEQSYRATQ